MIKEIYEAGKKYARVAIVASVLSLPAFCNPSCGFDYGNRPKARDVKIAQHTSQAKCIDALLD